MKRLVVLLAAVLAASGLAQAPQPQVDENACKFEVPNSTTKPTIAGPDEVTSRVYAVEQPDSPLEIVSVDYKYSWLTVSPGRVRNRDRCVVRVRNRSNRHIAGFEVMLTRSSGDGKPTGIWAGLAPGEHVEMLGCTVYGFGGDERVVYPIEVGWVDIGTCDYYPSRRLPGEILTIIGEGLGEPGNGSFSEDSCQFELSGKATEPTLTGPDEILRLVHVVSQPDSPLEIVAADFDGTWIRPYENVIESKPCPKIRIRNRSDREITYYNLELELEAVTDSTASLRRIGRENRTLNPGEEKEVPWCITMGKKRVSENTAILLRVGGVEMGTCQYYPSAAYPAAWGLQPMWGRPTRRR